MKKVLAWLLVLTLTAAISIGATLAYLMDTDEDVNVMTLGNVKIDQLEYERIDDETANDDAEVQEFHDHKPLYPAVTDKDFDYTPGDTVVDWTQIGKDGYTSEIWNPEKINNELDKMVFAKNKGDYDAYVRTVFAFEAGKYETLDEFKSMMHLNLNETDFTWTWVEAPVEISNEDGTENTKYFIAVATYNSILEPGKLTEISLSQLALDKTATNEDVEAFGETYQILVKTQAIQADGFEDPVFALNEGFGPVDETNIPWETDSPIKGSAVRNALHYLNADPTGTAITSNVTNITFGLKKDHAGIVDKYSGTLVDVDQDIPAEAYYVPNNGGYDIYILSNDVIYAPVDSSMLFKDMAALQTVDARNLDTSRAENFLDLFRNCTSLTTVNATGWDTSKVNTLRNAFRTCSKLQEVKGITNWNVSEVTDMYCTFYDCDGMVNLDLSGWNTGKVTRLDYAIANCDNLETVNATGWDLTSLNTANYGFRNNPKLKEVTGTGDWYMPNVTDLYGLFYNNPSIVTLDVSDWDTGKCTRYHDLFCACSSLETITGLENWDTGSATNMISLFNGCTSLKNFGDLSGWDVRNVTDIGYMFAGCMALEELTITGWDAPSLLYVSYMFRDARNLLRVDLSGWNTPSLTRMNSMFSSASQNTGNMKLQEFNLSGWDTSNVDTMGWMFYGCGDLVNVDLSNWNVTNCTTFTHMFADCFDLETVNFTGWSTPKVNNLDGMFNDCRKMKTVDMSMFDTSNVIEFSQMFEACWALERVIGMENWDTSSGQDFGEMFNVCSSLKEVDLSSFNTTNAKDSYVNPSNGDYNDRFNVFLGGCTSLEKITLGKNFSFDGDGSFTKWTFKMPSATKVNGWDGKWYTADGTGYLPADVPEETAATYYAVNPVKQATPPADSTNP